VTLSLHSLFYGSEITPNQVPGLHLVGGLSKDPSFLKAVKKNFPSSIVVTTVVCGAAREKSKSRAPPYRRCRSQSIRPAKKIQSTTTRRDNQTNVVIEIVEDGGGQREIGEAELCGIHPAQKGVPQIDLTVEINESGLLQVRAVETQSGQAITTKEALGKLQADVERH
jgi:hypothetical protein